MPRATIVLAIILVLVLAALVWLSHRSAAVPTHHIEQVVTVGPAGNAAQ